jgi:hypothetical protein
MGSTTPQRGVDIWSLLTGTPRRKGTSPVEAPQGVTPSALSPLDILPTGSGAAYPTERAIGLPVPGRTYGR